MLSIWTDTEQGGVSKWKKTIDAIFQICERKITLYMLLISFTQHVSAVWTLESKHNFLGKTIKIIFFLFAGSLHDADLV